EAQKMPDIKPNDGATFYTKAKLARVLRQIRFDRNTCVLPFKRLGTIYFLSRALLKATGVLMEPLVRVSEVDQAITDVKAAYQDALKAPNRLLTPAVPAVCAPAPAAS
ncbi:CAMP factor family pore-forming toxin, partial [Xanthomonas citri pv. citri]|nr:CAMP factor family pore-forming toxin [Xanthomonas citri pv. citri]